MQSLLQMKEFGSLLLDPSCFPSLDVKINVSQVAEVTQPLDPST